MSTVYEVRYGLLCEQLEQWVERLGGDEPLEPEVVKELAVRLLAMAAMLLRRHAVNMRGQCKFCGLTQREWRFWRRRPRCSVYGALDFAMRQGLDVVWWRLRERYVGLESRGNERRKECPTDEGVPRQ